MLAARIRSGLIETTHEGSIAVVSGDGDLIAHDGDIDRPFFLRSAAKPFQAATAQAQGAALHPVELALAAASHDGEPVQVAIVEEMLGKAGLDVSDLGCPPSWPLSEQATRRLHRAGSNTPRSIWHNCSGKHAAWLRACAAQGWPTATYLSPDHPLQVRIAEFVSELSGAVMPVGVDGCGAPVLATTARMMALLYARLATLPELGEVFTVMHRYPALVSGALNGDSALAITLDAVGKRAAAGCLAVALHSGLGVAIKAWDGSQEAACVGMVATLAALGALPIFAAATLAPFARVPVLGGGAVVGQVEPMIHLQWS